MELRGGAGVEAEAAESTDATGTAININNQSNKRAADESDGAQQPSASKKPRRNPRTTGSRLKRARQQTDATSGGKTVKVRDEREA